MLSIKARSVDQLDETMDQVRVILRSKAQRFRITSPTISI